MTTTRRRFADEISPSSIDALAEALIAVDPTFPGARFRRGAARGLGPLELKGRIAHVAAHLQRCLHDRPFGAAAALLADAVTQARLDTWQGWPAQTWLETYGLEHPEAALAAIARITPYATGEFAVRPYLERQPRSTLAVVRGWALDPDEHLRRLASEGTRPRLPWGRRLRAFVDDPTPVLDLLEHLVDDPSPYVRRSVANNLNDITKDHPDLAVATARRWSSAGGARRDEIVRRGLRSLVKQGNPDALEVLGFAHDAAITVRQFCVTPEAVDLGDDLHLHVELSTEATEPVRVVVDYVLHRVVANGTTSAKAYKLRTAEVSPDETTVLDKVHRLRAVTVRTYHPGRHRVELQVNGAVCAEASFDLRTGG